MYEELLLAIIQAATEFLPISSSGHLALAGTLLGHVSLFYITLLHLASTLAVIIYFRRDIKELLTKHNRESQRLLLYILFGIIPAGLVGLFFGDVIEMALTTPLVIGSGFLFTGVLLITTHLTQRIRNTRQRKNQGQLTVRRSLTIGLMQICALLPGVSRSGTTISAGILSGVNKETAFRFSFLIAIPLMVGAALLKFEWGALTLPVILGFILCFVVSLFALRLLEFTIQKNYFWMFGIYCLILGLITLLFLT